VRRLEKSPKPMPGPLDGAHALMSGQMRLRTRDPIAPARVSRDYRTTDREIYVSCYCPELSPRATRSSSS
jgi:hypothetical protein